MRASGALVNTRGGILLFFGPYTYDRASQLLWKDNLEVPVPPRASGVLDLLLDRPGQLVSKQELITTVWRDAFVTETSLAEAISCLRQTLGDDPQHPTYIQTLHRRGYRFIAEVRDRPAGGIDLPAEAVDFEAESYGVIGGDPSLRVIGFVPWTVALFAALVAVVAVWKFTHVAVAPPRPPARFTVDLPAGYALSSIGAPIAVSRDGRTIATSGCRVRAEIASGDCAIHLRPLSESEATLVAGTAGGASPFFSPDGSWLGYFADGKLLKIALAGGSPIALADALEPYGATWTVDGWIVFASSSTGGLFVVSERGGPAQPLTRPRPGGGGHLWPDALPDGSAVVFTVARESAQQEQPYAGVVSMRTRSWGRLLDGVSAVRAPLPGYLLAQRGRDLVGVTIDHRSLSIPAPPRVVAQGTPAASGAPLFAMARGGTLVTAYTSVSALQVVLDWDSEFRRLVPPPQPTILR